MNDVIDIIVPIFNGYEYLKPLFESVYKGSNFPHCIIIVEDHSTDKLVKEFLQQIDKYKNEYCEKITVHYNDSNLGFVKSVNFAVSLSRHHFVILNTDTEVPVGWLQRLFFPIFNDKMIASVTPLTNSGTICSFPNWLKDNPLIFGLSVEEIDNAFHNMPHKIVEVPTGVGFCMAINRSLVDEIGFFDAETFGRGYGEENDWCCRAIVQGYKNVIITNLFVFHKHGGSFGVEKQRLVEQNLEKLIKKHPTYNNSVAKFIEANPFMDMFGEVSFLMFLKFKPAIIFSHGWGGGADHFLEEHLLHDVNNDYVIVINGAGDSVQNNVVFFIKTENILTVTIKELSKMLSELQSRSGLSYYINHLVNFKDINNMVLELTSFFIINKIHPIFYLHDYFAICPTINLLNADNKYCGVPNDAFTCAQCLHELKIKNMIKVDISKDRLCIKKWRENMLTLLTQCDVVYAFSHYSIEVFNMAFRGNKLNIKLYILNKLPRLRSVVQKLPDYTRNKFITIGVLGAIGEHKGIHVIEKLADIIQKNHLPYKVVVVGYTAVPLDHIKHTGYYNKVCLPDICIKEAIDVFVIPSIWPETYSYTTDEIMQLGYPLFTFNMGAPVERVKKYHLGVIVDFVDTEYLLNQIVEFVKIHNFPHDYISQAMSPDNIKPSFIRRVLRKIKSLTKRVLGLL